jgi:cephalosporin hydroxylase
MLAAEDILAIPPDFDVFEVYREGDMCAESLGHDTLRRIYQTKYQIARALQPSRIFEIGVRAGYAAAAFLAAMPTAHYVGIDKDDGSHGGVVGYLDHARAMLPGRYPKAVVELHAWDSGDFSIMRRLSIGYAQSFNLVHVDGEHTVAGCLRDLWLSCELVATRGYLLVDDYDLLNEVHNAADQFLTVTQYEALYVPTPHGDMLIQLP